MATKSDKRIAYLDGLRALAVLSVLVFHAGVHDAAMQKAQSAATLLLSEGSHGVDLFFVLSGFCLAYPTLSRLAAQAKAELNVVGFAARRTIRILPPYYAAIALFAAVGFIVSRAHRPFPEGMDPAALSLSGVVQQMLFLDRDARFLDASFWTLAIEFRWYFVFPILLWVWTRSRVAFALIGLAVFCAGETRMNNVDLLFLPIFMLGIVAADIYARGYRIARVAYVMLPLSLIVAFATTAGRGWHYVEAGPFWGISMFWLVVAAGSTPALKSVLSWAPLTLIGFASYGIYLVHEPVIGLIQQYVGPFVPVSWTYLVTCAGALAAGLLFSFIAERPFVASALKDKLISLFESVFTRVFAACQIQPILTVASSPSRQAEIKETVSAQTAVPNSFEIAPLPEQSATY